MEVATRHLNRGARTGRLSRSKKVRGLHRMRTIGVAGLQQMQGRQDTAQTPITVLKRVYFKKGHNEKRNNDQWMQSREIALLCEPFKEIRHATRRIKR